MRSILSPFCGRVRKEFVKIALLILAILSASCGTPSQRSKRRLQYYLAMPSERGSVFAQGTLDGVNYRRLLRGAIAKDPASLRGLFRYTAHGQIMGEGATDNDEILWHLLHTWGDAAFARVLAAEPLEVRTAVVSAINDAWPHPGWQPAEFPATYRLGKASHRP